MGRGQSWSSFSPLFVHPAFELPEAVAADGDAIRRGVAFHFHFQFTARQGNHVGYGVSVEDAAAVGPEETGGVELFLQLVEGIIEGIGMSVEGSHVSITAYRGKQSGLAGLHRPEFRTAFDQEPLLTGGGQLLQQLSPVGDLGEEMSVFGEGLLQSRKINRLKELVYTVDTEGLESIGIVRRGKDHRGWSSTIRIFILFWLFI